ncbi:hypothetical protein [Kosakonia oryziphila]|uniref:Uncharacterized protein n=1 Tax=Kosakonia oryziphila TaxID=1005667 RepID=A0A1C4GAR3_9ENTR|nr:hypothetical protein GA0061070_10609 [Kosakonia oryziphila]
MNVRLNGLISGLVSYRYALDGRPLRRYPMEQQAQIITDWYILNTHGYIAWCTLKERGNITLDGDTTESVIRSQYQKTLQNFPWR